MAGGLLNLVAYGNQNVILNSNPKKTFFKTTYFFLIQRGREQRRNQTRRCRLHLYRNYRRRMFIRDRCSANGRWWVARGLCFGALPQVGIQQHISVEGLWAE